MTGLPATTTYHKTSSPAVATHTPPGKANQKAKAEDVAKEKAKAKEKIRAKAAHLRTTIISSNLLSANAFTIDKLTPLKSPMHKRNYKGA